MQLKDTVEMMNSEDFKERFKAEYYQLSLRLDGLTSMLIKWKNNRLDFEPKCSKETLENQVIFMQGYLGILRLRAEIEGIVLFKTDMVDYKNKILDTLDKALNDLSSEDFDNLIQIIQDYIDDLY